MFRPCPAMSISRLTARNDEGDRRRTRFNHLYGASPTGDVVVCAPHPIRTGGLSEATHTSGQRPMAARSAAEVSADRCVLTRPHSSGQQTAQPSHCPHVLPGPNAAQGRSAQAERPLTRPFTWRGGDLNPWLLLARDRRESLDQGNSQKPPLKHGKRVLNISHHFPLFLDLSRPKRGPRMKTDLTQLQPPS